MKNKYKLLLFVFVAISLLMSCCEQQQDKKEVQPVATAQASLLLFSNPLDDESSTRVWGFIGLAILCVLWLSDRKLNIDFAANQNLMSENSLKQADQHHKDRMEQNKLLSRMLKHMEILAEDRHKSTMERLDKIQEQLNKD